jgi:peptidoglycan/LPS O-acetylase OafA/YrhL
VAYSHARETVRHLPSLDGLRGLAAAAVVVSHFHLLFPAGALARSGKLELGDPAVGLFFALSGFLMAYLYNRRQFTLKSAYFYLVHRFARIYPAYLVAIILVIAVSAVPALPLCATHIGSRRNHSARRHDGIHRRLLVDTAGDTILRIFPPDLAWFCSSLGSSPRTVARSRSHIWPLMPNWGYPDPESSCHRNCPTSYWARLLASFTGILTSRRVR